jgi:hypothetical protein
MGRKPTGWQEKTEVITGRFNTSDPQQARAVELIRHYQSYGRSVGSILTTALLASEGEQFQEPTLGDVAAQQIMVSVQELGELLNELKQWRTHAVAQPSVQDSYSVDEVDYTDQVVEFLRKRKGR